MNAPTHQVQANLLLCDAAQVVGDKLYILGGGWSYIWLAQPGDAFGLMVAIDLILPWDFANRRLPVVTRVVTEDSEEVIPENYDGNPARAEGQLVAGRAPTARPGTDLHAPLVIPFMPMVLEPGGYVCELVVENVTIRRASFQVAVIGQV